MYALLTPRLFAAFQENPEVNLDVFLHKSDAVSDDFRKGAIG